jgi:hypothetical protein
MELSGWGWGMILKKPALGRGPKVETGFRMLTAKTQSLILFNRIGSSFGTQGGTI